MHRVSTGRLILQIIIVATSVMNEVVLVNLDFTLFAKRWLHGPDGVLITRLLYKK